MGKKKVKAVINGKALHTLKDLLDYLKTHPLLQHCTLEDLEGGDGTGRLIWARNPGSVFWPALIANLEDERGLASAPEGMEVEGAAIGPEQYRCVMFLETAFRFSVLQWKDIILVDHDKFDEQVELVYQMNIHVIKRTWRREKPYKDAVCLLREFMSLDVGERQAHAFSLSLERKQLISITNSQKQTTPKSLSGSSVSGGKREKDEVEKKPRTSENYSLRPTINQPTPTYNPTEVYELKSASRHLDTPSPSVDSSAGSETLSDISRKAKERPKVGGPFLKQYVETRFMCMDKSFKFMHNGGWKCAECLDSIEQHDLSWCHDLPHHKKCLVYVPKKSKDGTTIKLFKCKCCADQACYVCKKVSESDEKIPTKCTRCELRYHRHCLLKWPQAVVQGSQGPITCPAHFCHTCVGEHYVLRKVRNFKVLSKEGRYRCLKCPSTYHKQYCLPAGSGEDITGRDFVICPRHTLPNLKVMQRRFGCLTCGRNMKSTNDERIECSFCLQVFHPECVGYSDEHIEKGISFKDFGKDYQCSSCFWGLFPIYGQPVWFQQPLNKFWPARILYPKESSGRYPFCDTREQGLYSLVYFGATQTYYDKASRASPLSLATVKLFTTVKVYQEENVKIKSAFDEAGFYSQLWDELRDQVLPPPEPFYRKIDRNIYRMSVSTTKKSKDHIECVCGEQEDSEVCTPNSGCPNRDTAIECNDSNCSGQERCQNRMFSRKTKDTDNTEQFLTPGKGWAVRATKDFKEGEFIVEYCGEIINNAEMQYRANRKTEEDPLYILEIDKHTFIDAEFCGNVSRLINHSCEPNCRIEKYTSAEGKPVVGVFAHTDIDNGEELTFDYAYGNNSSAPFRCHCGAPSCRGYIGKRVSQSELDVVDVVNPELEKYDKECAKCCFGGHVLCCDFDGCLKVYHKSCVGLTREPQNEWYCPDHKAVPIGPRKRKSVSSATSGPPAKKQQINGINQNIPVNKVSIQKLPLVNGTTQVLTWVNKHARTKFTNLQQQSLNLKTNFSAVSKLS